MFLIAIAFLAGHCLVHSLPELPSLWPWVAVPLAAALLAGRWRVKWAVAFLLGIVWAWSHASWRLADRLPADVVSLDTDVRGYIASIVDVNSEGIRFALDVRDAGKPLPSQIELSWYNTRVRPAPGELWQFSVRVKSPRGFANPGGADFAAQLFRNGVGASGYVRDTRGDTESNVRLSAASWKYFVLCTRDDIARRLEKGLPNSPMLGIVQGLAVGDTSRIDSAQWRVFANTGITHLLAISGSHITMVAAMMAWLGGFIARRLPLQKRRITVHDVQSVAGMFAAIVYCSLAGLSVPTQRTLVMLVVYFGTRLLRRHIGITQSLSLALIGVLIVDPFAPLSAGFWLSFGAVAAIFLATSGRIARLHWTAEYFHLQAAVSIGLLPFLIGAFGSVSLISPLVNLFAIPLFSFVLVPSVLLGTLLLMINEWLGTWVVRAAGQFCEWSWPLFEWASRLPLATWHVPQLPIWIATMLVLGCLIAIAPGMLATRLAGAMLCLPAFLWQPPRPQVGEFEIAVLDVGQGLAVALITQTHVMVYDTGPSFRSGNDTGQLVVLPYLYSRGVRSIDALMLTHGDNDHVGGAQSVLAGLPTQQILAGPSVTLPQHLQRCERGQSWRWDEVTFTVLHPPAGDAARKNNSSCVLRVEGAGGSALLLGDIEHESEERLAADSAIKHADIVVVPHHGSRTSSTEALTQSSSPKYALTSAGFDNHWGFPKPEVVARWQATGAQVLKTADSGAIEIVISRRGVEQPREYRAVRRAYWRQ